MELCKYWHECEGSRGLDEFCKLTDQSTYCQADINSCECTDKRNKVNNHNDTWFEFFKQKSGFNKEVKNEHE